MHKIVRNVLMIVMLLLATAVVLAQDENEVVRIGGIHPLSGGLANDGQGMNQAIQMAVDDINESGMLEGFTLEYVSADSTGDAAIGQQAALNLITEDDVSVLVGTFQSAVSENIALLASRVGVPLVIDVSAGTEITETGRDEDGNQWAFRIQPNAEVMGATAAQYVVDMAEAYDIPLERVGYMHEGGTAYGGSVYDAFEDAADELDLVIGGTIAYDFGVDYSVDIDSLSDRDLDAVMVTGYYGDGFSIAETMANVGLDTGFVMGVAQGTYDQALFVEEAGELAECFFNSNYRWDNRNETALETLATYEERFDEPMTAADVLSWQSIYIIADAIERAESGDPAAIQMALEETEYEDHILPYEGAITFEGGEAPNALPIVMQVQDGEVVQVFPEAFAEAEPRFCTSWE